MLVKAESFIIFSVFLFGSALLGEADQQCTQKLQNAGIIPKILKKCGNTDIRVTFSNIAHQSTNVQCGQTVSNLKTILSPEIQTDVSGKCDSSYVQIIIFDVDYPFSDSYILWKVNNVPSDVLRDDGWYTGLAGIVTDTYHQPVFIGNRYVVAIFCQTGPYSVQYFTERQIPDYEKRNSFNVTRFSEDLNEGEQDPAACTFFKSGV